MSVRRRPEMYEKYILPKRKRYGISHKCIDCGKETEFYRCDSCRENSTKYAKNWREKNHDHVLKKGKEWRNANRNKIKEHNKKSNAKQYGFSVGEYEEMLRKPCGICKDNNKRKGIDHSHTSNKIRGVLCLSCNSKLGWYEKYKQSIENWIKHQGKK